MSSPFNPLTALTPSAAPPHGIGGATPTSGALPLSTSLLDGLSPHPHPFLSPAPGGGGPGTPGTPWLQLVNLAPGFSTPGGGSVPLPGLGGLPGAIPGPSGQFGGTALLPGAGALGGAGGTPGQGQAQGPQQLTLTLPALGPSAQAAQDADETLRAIPDIARLLERAEAVRADIVVLEKGLFVAGAGAERAGTLGRLEALQLDYAQTLFALISLSSTYLVGALPLHLAGITEAGGGAAAPSAAGAGVGGGAAGAAGGAGAGGLGAPPAAAAPSVSPGSAARNTANTNGSGSGAGAGGGAAPGAASASTPTPAMPTTAELAAWTEARAQTMFARREAVRVASRAVGDVLKGVRQ